MKITIIYKTVHCDVYSRFADWVDITTVLISLAMPRGFANKG